MMEFFSPGHLVVVAIVAAVLFFGWQQLPDMARSLGRSLRIFRTEIKAISEIDEPRSGVRAEPAAGNQPPAAAEQPPRPAPRPQPRTEAPAETI